MVRHTLKILQHLALATLLKKSFLHGCFPVNFVKILRTPFFTEQLRRLFLDAGSIYLSLYNDKMYLLSMWLSLNLLTDIPYFKVTSENIVCTLLKKLLDENTLNYHFDKIFLVYGAR